MHGLSILVDFDWPICVIYIHIHRYMNLAVLPSISFQALVDSGVRHVVLCSRSGRVSADAPGQLAQRLLLVGGWYGRLGMR